ncbi:MAG TPA: hypothetical protein VEJ89_07350 [Myxococcaceae bacterium]|jgi:hypothetical protein|nr:hypothetical protein [Myxococcaceae bacterium]
MLRTAALSVLLLAALSPGAARALDVSADCTIDAKPGDVVAKGRDVVVDANKRVNDVVAVDGNVTLRKGVHAKSVIAVNGSVTLEAGAKVTGSAISFGGKVKVAPDAKVEGSRLELGDGIHIKNEDGKDVSLDFSIGGEGLGQLLAGKISGAARNCRIVEQPDGGTR